MNTSKISLLLALALSAACFQNPADETGEPETVAEPKSPDAPPPADGPEPTAEAVWNHLEQADYRENWIVWPGKGKFFEGNDPHGALLTNYLNPPALEALETDADRMPAGAIIVKDNFSPDKELVAVTVMYKSAGFDSQHHDWFWMKRNAAGEVSAAGKVQSCQSCHAQATENDYIMTGPLN